MNHLWRGKVCTIPGPVLNYGEPDTGGAQFMLVTPSKNPGCPIFGIGMPHARSGGDALSLALIGHDFTTRCVSFFMGTGAADLVTRTSSRGNTLVCATPKSRTETRRRGHRGEGWICRSWGYVSIYGLCCTKKVHKHVQIPLFFRQKMGWWNISGLGQLTN